MMDNIRSTKGEKRMANRESFRVEWTDDDATREVKIRLKKNEIVIQRGRGVKVYVSGGKVAARKGRRVKGVELLRTFDPGGLNLSPGQVPEETVIFTRSSPRCVNIPTRSGWVRW